MAGDGGGSSEYLGRRLGEFDGELFRSDGR